MLTYSNSLIRLTKQDINVVKFTVFNKKTKPLLGIDIGSTSIKAIYLQPQADGFLILGCAHENIIGNAFVERDIKDFDAISHTLKKIKHQLQLQHANSVIAVAGPSIISKVVQMEENLADHWLEEQLLIEADSLIPYPLEEVYLDFESLGASTTHSGKEDILLTAAHRNVVDTRTTLLREEKLNPVVVDTELNALANAYQLIYPAKDRQKTTVFLHIGTQLLHVLVLENETVVYAKDHNFGTGALLQDIMLAYQLERQEAVQKLTENTLPDGWEERVLPIFYSQLQQNISRALQLMQHTVSDHTTQQIVLSGAVAMLPNICPFLSTELGIPCAQVVFQETLHWPANKPELAKRCEHLLPLMTLAIGLSGRSTNPCHR